MNILKKNYIFDVVALGLAFWYSYNHSPEEKYLLDNSNMASLMMAVGAFWTLLGIFKMDNIACKVISLLTGLSVFIFGYVWHDWGIFRAILSLGMSVAIYGWIVSPFFTSDDSPSYLYYSGLMTIAVFLMVIGYCFMGTDKPYNNDDRLVGKDRPEEYYDGNRNDVPDIWEESIIKELSLEEYMYDVSPVSINYAKFEREKPLMYERYWKKIEEAKKFRAGTYVLTDKDPYE